MGARTWRNFELNFLRENAENMSIQRMADALGRSYASIYNQLNYYGIPYKKIRDYKYWTTCEAKRMFKMREEGKTFSEIAVTLGRDKDCCIEKYGNLKKTKEEVRQVSK